MERARFKEIMELLDLVEMLGILDYTLPNIEEPCKCRRKLQLPTWISHEVRTKYIQSMQSSSPSPHLLRIASRRPVTEAEQFNIFSHYDLRTLESITDLCLDLLQPPRNIIRRRYGGKDLGRIDYDSLTYV